MGRTYDGIDDRLRDFLGAQPVFFTGTAPREGGHVNVSPKGIAGTFTVIDEATVAYLDLTGSGIETIAHLRENGRITLMFCAFEGPPRIVRLQGIGEVIVPGDDRFVDLCARFEPMEGVRAVIVVALDRVSDSCGYGVPTMALDGERSQMWASFRAKGGEPGLQAYRAEKNAVSIDGLPGLSGAG